MISILGIFSAVILLLCVTVLAMHRTMLKYRAPVDESLAQLDDLLHERLALLGYDTDGDIQDMWHVLSTITDDMAQDAALQENTMALAAAIQAYNASLGPYNAFISRFPGCLIADMTGLVIETPLQETGPFV